MNERTQFLAAGFVCGMILPHIMPVVRGYGERPPLVPTILIGLGFGVAMWLIYPLILG